LCRLDRLALEDSEVQIQPGEYFEGIEAWEFMNKVDNITGKIDYAIGVSEPQSKKEGVFAEIWFKIKACGVSSNVGFDFAQGENRETVFVAQSSTDIIGHPVDVQSNDITIHVPLVLNDFNETYVYPNPVHKGEIVTFAKVPAGKSIKLRIFNIAGELVYEGEKKSDNDNKISKAWDLRNKDNEYVASGIYIYLLEYQGLTKKGKIGVIK